MHQVHRKCCCCCWHQPVNFGVGEWDKERAESDLRWASGNLSNYNGPDVCPFSNESLTCTQPTGEPQGDDEWWRERERGETVTFFDAGWRQRRRRYGGECVTADGPVLDCCVHNRRRIAVSLPNVSRPSSFDLSFLPRRQHISHLGCGGATTTSATIPIEQSFLPSFHSRRRWE